MGNKLALLRTANVTQTANTISFCSRVRPSEPAMMAANPSASLLVNVSNVITTDTDTNLRSLVSSELFRERIFDPLLFMKLNNLAYKIVLIAISRAVLANTTSAFNCTNGSGNEQTYMLIGEKLEPS